MPDDPEYVTVVAHVGLGSTYEVLEPGEETETSGGIDHYSVVKTLPPEDVGSYIADLEERFATTLRRRDDDA